MTTCQATKVAPICYIEIPAPNPAKSAAFYSAVFGWQCEASKLSELDYWMFNTGEAQLQGGFTAEKPVQQGGIIFYISVEDIDGTLRQIEVHGGTIVFPKEAIGGEYGFTATFKDPNGNQIGLWTKT